MFRGPSRWRFFWPVSTKGEGGESFGTGESSKKSVGPHVQAEEVTEMAAATHTVNDPDTKSEAPRSTKQKLGNVANP